MGLNEADVSAVELEKWFAHGGPRDIMAEYAERQAKELAEGRKVFACYLDSDEKHPALFGECILPRDDDGTGFALNLESWRGKYVKITIEVINDPRTQG